MNEQEEPTQTLVPGAEAAQSAGAAIAQMTALVTRLSEVADAAACVGPAETVEGHVLVPIATVNVSAGFGFGFGGGGGGSGSDQGSGSGGGGGGGGRSSARIIAAIDLSENGVAVKPVLDISSIILAVLALIGLRLLTNGPARRGLIGLLKGAQD